jgi:hypothetical protein
VANALHRKVNRTDVEQMIESKADASDLEKLINLIENKGDSAQIDSIMHRLD